jgi:hypothetical protein
MTTFDLWPIPWGGGGGGHGVQGQICDILLILKIITKAVYARLIFLASNQGWTLEKIDQWERISQQDIFNRFKNQKRTHRRRWFNFVSMFKPTCRSGVITAWSEPNYGYWRLQRVVFALIAARQPGLVARIQLVLCILVTSVVSTTASDQRTGPLTTTFAVVSSS